MQAIDRTAPKASTHDPRSAHRAVTAPSYRQWGRRHAPRTTHRAVTTPLVPPTEIIIPGNAHNTVTPPLVPPTKPSPRPLHRPRSRHHTTCIGHNAPGPRRLHGEVNKRKNQLSGVTAPQLARHYREYTRTIWHRYEQIQCRPLIRHPVIRIHRLYESNSLGPNHSCHMQ